MEFFSLSPNRIDFSGGSLDLYPINFIEEGITLNGSINLWSSVRIIKRDKKGFKIVSENGGRVIEAEAPEKVTQRTGLELIIETLKTFKLPWNFEIIIRTDAPAGSGLGSSSSLVISLIAAIMKARGEVLDNERIIRRASIVETRHIRIPVGMQDYFASVYGGFNVIYHTVDGEKRKELQLSDAIVSALNRRLILSYTHVSHNSAKINWRIIKDYIDGKRYIRSAIKNIKAITTQMINTLQEGDLDEFGRLMDEEWKNRRGMAKGITLDWIDDIMERIKAHGAIGSKLCGAGGGGCMITLASEGRIEDVRMKLNENGFKLLDYKFVKEGVKVFEKEGDFNEKG